jgi:Photoprotection regulator fluorescence recovery protein
MSQNQNDASTRAQQYIRTESAWSHAEKRAARRIFDKAYRRQCHSIRDKLKSMIAAAVDPPDIWRIHDYLSEERRRTDKLFDYRYSVLILVFARLLADGLLTEAELNELSPEKAAQIRRIVES